MWIAEVYFKDREDPNLILRSKEVFPDYDISSVMDYIMHEYIEDPRFSIVGLKVFRGGEEI